MKIQSFCVTILSAVLVLIASSADAAEDWTQFKFDARHSGDVPDRSLKEPLGLLAAAACSDSIFTAPVVAGGRVFVVDGSGVAWCYDGKTLEVLVEGLSKKPHVNQAENNNPQLIGRTSGDTIVVFNGPETLAGNFATVKITRTTPMTLFGQLIG